ncbi:MAG: type IV pilus modification protein PilV [Burkholderiales bacterium]
MILKVALPGRPADRGFTMIEVLVTIIILTIGLLGLAGLQARLQVAEIEAYQRAQAILVLQDMVARINANRKNVTAYVTASPLGEGNAVQSCAGKTGADLDLCEWGNMLLGATETSGTQSVGAMIGARGCVSNPVATMPRQMNVAVVWQGLTPTAAPTNTTCGSGLYGNEATRRALVATIVIGCLQNDLTTGVCVTP